jgi:ABC-type branched-subunit amino acid transport system permease subunit
MQLWNIDRIRKGRDEPVDSENSRIHFVYAPLSRLLTAAGYGNALFERIGELKDRVLNTIFSAISLVLSFPGRYLGQLRSLIGSSLSSTTSSIGTFQTRAVRLIPINRETPRGSWIAFGIMLIILIAISWSLPSVSSLTKTMQVARIITLVGIFGLMTFSLNLHTGLTGMTNFGVIFFVGIGAISVGLLSAPVETNGYGLAPWQATIIAVVVSAIAGWLLAYPTSRLRMDYFAIVTISLGEMLRISLQAEPLLRAGTVTSAIGISQYTRPLEGWWESGPAGSVGSMLSLDGPAPYLVFLAVLTMVAFGAVWYLLDTIFSSPWGRILRSIREDEEVTQHHGHNILTHKAASLALGAAVAALAGALWAWLNTSIFPDFMHPSRSTFLVWAAFIVGGRANNRGMVIGAFLIVIVEFVFNVMVIARSDSSLAFHNVVSYIDTAFSWLIVDFGGYIWSAISISEVFPKGVVNMQLTYLKLALIGAVIVGALMLSAKGLLPEVPGRPKRPRGTGESEPQKAVEQ